MAYVAAGARDHRCCDCRRVPVRGVFFRGDAIVTPVINKIISGSFTKLELPTWLRSYHEDDDAANDAQHERNRHTRPCRRRPGNEVPAHEVQADDVETDSELSDAAYDDDELSEDPVSPNRRFTDEAEPSDDGVHGEQPLTRSRPKLPPPVAAVDQVRPRIGTSFTRIRALSRKWRSP